MLSCSVLAARIDGKKVTTMEGLQAEAEEFGTFLANEGAEQCGFCNPGFIMNVLAMEDELNNPTEEEIKAYLSGNLCRCTGYAGQMAGRSETGWNIERRRKEETLHAETSRSGTGKQAA